MGGSTRRFLSATFLRLHKDIRPNVLEFFDVYISSVRPRTVDCEKDGELARKLPEVKHCGAVSSGPVFVPQRVGQISERRSPLFPITHPVTSTMSSSLPINQPDLTAPTPQNTPLQHAPISQGLSRPTVPDIQEDAAEGEADAEELTKALQSSAAQNALQGMVQSRLTSLIGKSSGYVESLPVEVKRSLAALQAVQTKQTELQNQFKREVWELEKKVRHLIA